MPIESDAEFPKSLQKEHRKYVLRRQREAQARLQVALVDFSRELSAVSSLNGNEQALLLDELGPSDEP